MDGLAGSVDHQRVVEVGIRVDVPVGHQAAAAGQQMAGVVEQGQLEPSLVGVVGAPWEGVANARVSHHDLETHRLARMKPRCRRIEQRLDAAVGPTQRHQVDAQLVGPQVSLGARQGLLVTAHIGQRRVGGQESVGAHAAVARRHIRRGYRLIGHVTVLTSPPIGRQVEGPRRVAGHAAVVPVIELVLSPHPAVAIEARVKADLVTRAAVIGGPEVGLEHLLLVNFGSGLQHGIVQEAAHAVGGVGEQIRVFLRVGHVVVAVAGAAVGLVNGVAGQAGQAGLGRGLPAVHLASHLAGQHQGGVVAPRAPLGLHLSFAARQVREGLDVGVNLRIAVGRIGAHVDDGGFVERVVERGVTVGRGRPLLHNAGVATPATGRADAGVHGETVTVKVARQGARVSLVLAGQHACREVVTGGGRRRGREERAGDRDVVGRHIAGRSIIRHPPARAAGALFLAGREGLGRSRGVGFAVIGQPVQNDRQQQEAENDGGGNAVTAG